VKIGLDRKRWRLVLAAVWFIAACTLSVGSIGLLMFAPVQTIEKAFTAGALMGLAGVLFLLARAAFDRPEEVRHEVDRSGGLGGHRQ